MSILPKELQSEKAFTEWLKKQSYITTNSYSSGDEYLLDAVCYFTGDNEDNKQHKGKDRWSNEFHKDCMLAIGIKANVGGTSGGSCWDTSNPTRYTNSNVNVDLTDVLVDIISYFDEHISMIAFMKIQRLAKQFEYTQYEYYGNSDDYVSKYILVKDLYEALETWIACKP